MYIDSMAGILIVDDDDRTRGVMKRILNSDLHTVLEAHNGREALQIVRTLPIDLVITDILMSERDGLDVIAELRKTRPWIKVFAYSGGGVRRDSDVLTLAKELGAHAAIQKPFSVSDLLSAVDELLARPS